MSFNQWLNTFALAVDTRCVFTMNELRTAHKSGKDARQVARDNDALCREYTEVYGDDAEEVMAA